MPSPTVADFTGRLRRVLADNLAPAGTARAQLALDGAKHGHYTGSSSRFRLQEEALAKEHLVKGLELALSEMRRVAANTSLDPGHLRSALGEVASEHLDALIAATVHEGSPAFGATIPTAPTREKLTTLMADILHEYDCGLYPLPGDATAPVTINVTDVRDSQVGAIQQGGSGASQGRSE